MNLKRIIKINFISVLILVICSIYMKSYAEVGELKLKSQAPETEPVVEEVEQEKMQEEARPERFPDMLPEDPLEGVEENAETELDNLKNKKSDLSQDVSDSYLVMGLLQSQLSDMLMEIEELNLIILEKQAEIEQLENKKQKLEEEIKVVETDLEETTIKYNKKKEMLGERLVAMYEMGETTYLDMLLHSKSLSEFLSTYYMISEIAKVDQDAIEDFSNTKSEMEKLSKTLSNNKVILEQTLVAQEKNQVILQNNLIIQNNKLKNISDEERMLHEQIAAYEEELSKLESEIKMLSLATVGSEYVGGVMAWPVPGYTRITSQFGMRTHPITGIYKLHTGVDIGAPMGTNFIAANDGIVVKAGYNAAYGNMVILDHGGGVQTLYAHGSEILVQAGDIVRQSTPILAVGSTGYSTGPHAHFEVRINGEYVEPLDYITSYNIVKMQDIKLDEIEEQKEENEEPNEEPKDEQLNERKNDTNETEE